MAQLAIKGHATRGKEVIELLEMLGGKKPNSVYSGKDTFHYYYIDNETSYITTKLYTNNCLTKLTYNIFTLEEFLEKYPYKIGDRVLLKGVVKTIKQVCWDNTENEVIYKLETNVRGFSEEYYVHHYDLQPYKEETMESKPNLLQQLKEYFDNTTRDVLEKEWHEYDKYNEIGPTVNEYLEYVNKSRQPQYPKTYEECCKVLGYSGNYNMILTTDVDNKLFNALYRLKVCRDAYWKIAGEQLELGKPWEPDWADTETDKYVIEIVKNTITIHDYPWNETNHLLAFPTKEIRDAFYENFKDLINQCKELL